MDEREVLMKEISAATLQVSGLTLGDAGGGRLADWSTVFGAGLSLIVDEEDAFKGALLRVLAGEARPRAGMVRWCGVEMAGRLAAAPESVFWRDPRSPWPGVSPRQWAREQAARHPVWSEDDWRRHVQGWALEEHLHKEMFRLSTGSKRKVLLAAAFASGAPLTLIDEPEAALDRSSILYLREALGREAERCRENGRIWIVAHYGPMPGVPWAQVLAPQQV